jgi:UDP-N-acetylmuramyl pentapeptide synthase
MKSQLITIVKRLFYFPLAYYFRFFAQIQLAIWKPRIVVVTGSSGKTSLLHLVESQLVGRARYSHQANSSYGIPFDILGLKRKDLVVSEWIYLFLAAPFRAFKRPYQEKLYIVEADCDRPREGRFLAGFLKPEVTIWISLSRTHSVNFDRLIANGNFSTVEEAIAHEFGYFLEYTTHLAIVNGDSQLINKELKRLKTQSKIIKKKEQLENYKVMLTDTEFKISNERYVVKALLPEESFYSIAMTKELLKYLNMDINRTFPGFELPPGRSSVFKGFKNTTIVDSSYNATLDGMTAVLNMFDHYPGKTKWVVLGDMIELGKEEQQEHEKLAELIASTKLSKIILMGPRVSKYTYPKLRLLTKNGAVIEKFTLPKESLDYLLSNIQGEEVILFKGARFLEGVIEHLLSDKRDVSKLCRREKIWQTRRKKWGL